MPGTLFSFDAGPLYHAVLSLVTRKQVDALPPLVKDLTDVRTTIYVGLAGYTILLWDHIITLSDEVEHIWKGRKGLVILLFFINRYMTPLAFIVNLFAYLSPSWTPECRHFVRYEGAMTVIGINIVALMMLIRIWALYRKNRIVIALVASCFCAELAVNAWLLSHGVPVIHNPSIHSCTMVFDDSVGSSASASAFLPLIYDTFVLVLTLNRIIGPIRRKTTGRITRILLRDGILYYSVIFSVTLVLTVMISAAPPGIQNVAAQLEYLLTVAMMSRITLHLRKQACSQESGQEPPSWTPLSPVSLDERPRLQFARTTSARPSVEISVAVEETSIIHDDRGNIVDCPGARGRAKNGAVFQESYELRSIVPIATPEYEGDYDENNIFRQ